jgi:hypothetical protein
MKEARRRTGKIDGTFKKTRRRSRMTGKLEIKIINKENCI